MIRGYFDPDSSFGRGATIPALILVHGVTTKWKMVYFLIDSGSATTSIHPRDADESLDINLTDIKQRPDWPRAIPSIGIGGHAMYFPLAATYAFVHHDGHWQQIEGEVQLAQPTVSNKDLPSILGWDILERFRVTMDWRTGIVTLEQ